MLNPESAQDMKISEEQREQLDTARWRLSEVNPPVAE